MIAPASGCHWCGRPRRDHDNLSAGTHLHDMHGRCVWPHRWLPPTRTQRMRRTAAARHEEAETR